MELLPVRGLPEIHPGDDLGALIAGRAALQDGDVVVVAQKVISKAEGCLRRLADVEPGEEAVELARQLGGGADPRLVQVVLDESIRVVRAERVLIVETRQGYICANGGVDHSNVEAEGTVSLL